MRTNRSIRLGIALIVGAFVLLLLYFIFRGRNSQTNVAQNAAPPEGVTPVAYQTGRRAAIALVDIPERSIITPDMFRVEELPEDVARADYVTDPRSQAVGFITRRRIPRNSRIRISDLVGHITEVGVAGALRPGMRAMMVPLANKPTFHDLVHIGDTVDIIAAFDQQESRTIVEGVRVLAVDVFGKDYPPTSLAPRGPYKAPMHSIGAATPPAPAGNAPSNNGTPAATGTPAAGGAAPAPTPTPTPTPAPAAPAPAITVEVTPEQANRISLAQNAGAAIDFIIVPRETPVIAPGGETRVAVVTKAQLAPYAERHKQAGSTPAGNAKSSGGSRARGTEVSYVPPVLPPPAPSSGVTPAGISVPPAPSTYEIPVYVDGKRVRTDVVRRPQESHSID
jgi:Flp pilus assembly protein CpaB